MVRSELGTSDSDDDGRSTDGLRITAAATMREKIAAAAAAGWMGWMVERRDRAEMMGGSGCVRSESLTTVGRSAVGLEREPMPPQSPSLLSPP